MLRPRSAGKRLKAESAKTTTHKALVAYLAVSAAVAYYFIDRTSLTVYIPAATNRENLIRGAVVAVDAVAVGATLSPAQRWEPHTQADLAADSGSEPRRFTISDTRLATTPCVTLWRESAHLISRGSDAQLLVWRQNASEFVLARGQESRFDRSRGLTQTHVTQESFWKAADDTPSDSLMYHFGPVDALGEALAGETTGLGSFLAIHDEPTAQDMATWPGSETNVWLSHGGKRASMYVTYPDI